MNTATFGKLVYECEAKSGEIELFEEGFRGVTRGQEMSARWEDVAAVRRFHQKATVAMIEIVTVRAEIHLLDGRIFHLEGNDDQTALAARYVGSLTNPHIARRMMEQLSSPAGVSFSHDIRATRAGLQVAKRGKWKNLPFENIAGYKVTQGFCLIDENPAAPRLAEQVFLGRLQNPDVFMTLLEVMAPGKDLAEKPYPFTPGLFDVTAANHDPRYLSMRARGLGCLIAIGVVLVGGIFALIGIQTYMHFDDKERREAVAVLNQEFEKHQQDLGKRVTEIANAPPPSVSLREACRGKTVDLTRVTIAMAGVESGVTGAGKEPTPWYTVSDTYGFGNEKPEVESKTPTQFVTRLLQGTTLDPQANSVVRAHVQVFQKPGEPMVCEGLAEGSFRVTESIGSLKERAHRSGLYTAIVAGMCPSDAEVRICKGLKERGDIYFVEGPLPAPSSSVSTKPKGKAPLKK